MAKKKASRDELIFLEDISDCIGKIEQYVTGLTEREFEESTEKQDAVIRRIEIIGEAVKNISDETKNKYPNIEWRDIAGMRDVVIHQYFGVTIGMVWKVATSDILKLRKKIQEVIKGFNKQ